MEKRCQTCLLNYFGSYYGEKVSKSWKGIIRENKMYFDDGFVGGWSSFYCSKIWNKSTLENDADLGIFDLLFEIDIKNGADPTKIANWLCFFGAFEALKVRNGFFNFHNFLNFSYCY